MELVKIGTIQNPNLKLRAKHYGAIVIRNYIENVDEVYVDSTRAEVVKSKLFPRITLIEKGGHYYYITPIAMIEITFHEYSELLNRIQNN